LVYFVPVRFWVFMGSSPYRDKKVVGVFVRFRAPFIVETRQHENDNYRQVRTRCFSILDTQCVHSVADGEPVTRTPTITA
jgi:hypothetical protein